MTNISTLKSSIEDITLPDKRGPKFRETESALDRVKRQKNEFFTLLTTQLKNQDPLSPMDTAQMTQQIFSINAVEQQLETNKHLEDIKEFFSISHGSSYLNYIDKVVSYKSDNVLVENGLGVFNYEILDEASSAQIQIKDKFKNVIHTQSISAKAGPHTFNWKKPDELEDGIYTFSLDVKKFDDSPAQVRSYGSGRINGIVNQDGKNLFEVNGTILPLEDIHKISNSTLGSILKGI